MDTETNTTPEAQVIATLAQQAIRPEIIYQDSIPILVTAAGVKVSSLEALNNTPARAKAQVNLTTLADHVAYIKSQRDTGDNTVLFANRESLKFHTLLCYHGVTAANWLDHSVTTQLRLSKQVQTWVDRAGLWMPQEQFAEFLDENLGDIQDPVATSVLDFVECLQCTRKESFRSALNQTTGEVQFMWEKSNNTEDRATILRDFTLGIPVWHRGEPIAIKARLQHRIKEGEGGKAGVNFRFKLEHLDRIQDTLWEEALTKLRTDLENEASIYEGIAPSAPEPLKIG